jgi:hypothetical protein
MYEVGVMLLVLFKFHINPGCSLLLNVSFVKWIT